MSNDESKPYYKEYMPDKSNPEYSATDALCWDVIDCRVRSGEVISEAGINTYIEHPDQKDLSHWWVITTPNAGHVPTAPIGIRQLQARADGRFGLDDRTLHPQMYVLGFEYICCIPRKDESRHMLWWTPTLADCSTFQSPPNSCRTGWSPAGILRTLPSSGKLAELGRTGTEFSRIPAKLEYIFKL